MKRLSMLVLTGVLIAVWFIPLHILEIRDVKKGKAVFIQRVSRGETFSLTFVHSVEKSPVTDYFRFDDTFRIVLYETSFRSLNAGLPATISEGQRLIRTEQGFRLSGIDRTLPDIQLWVHEKYEGAMVIGARVLSLAALAGNTLLQVRVRKVLLWEYMLLITN
jgi:hypothetical protein